MQIQCLGLFKGGSSFMEFSEFVKKNDWKIDKRKLEERVEINKNKDYFIMLCHLFKSRINSIFNLNGCEVITWIDTFVLLRRVIDKLKSQGVYTEKLTLINEYPLVFGNYTRADFLIIYERLIIILELGMFNQDEKRSEERYTKKLQASMNYKALIENHIDKCVNVTCYTMVYKPEFNSYNNTIMSENTVYNEKEVNKLVSFIKMKIEKEEALSAYSRLISLENYRF